MLFLKEVEVEVSLKNWGHYSNKRVLYDDEVFPVGEKLHALSSC